MMATEVRCPNCDGAGWNTEAGHGCNGDDSVCGETCPVPEQVECATCSGLGYIEAEA